jgi:hypothetical protein
MPAEGEVRGQLLERGADGLVVAHGWGVVVGSGRKNARGPRAGA